LHNPNVPRVARRRNIAPAEALYLGNDARKDIHPAASLGFRTALFAGDARSLRLRESEPGLLPPDAILTELSQIISIFAL
jgi:putative hydrolase of the HAD superfamily